jgi:hypothetical protein
MWRIVAGLFFALVFASQADAKCTGASYNVRLGTELNLQRTTDGARCRHNIRGSRDPIYGIDIRTRPKHGTLTIVRRLTIDYRPNPGFKGNDSYSFQWVGKLGGSTPSAMTMNISVTVR